MVDGVEEMVGEILICSNCKTGKVSYELDMHSVVCPYIGCLNNGKCQFYEPFEENEKNQLTKKD